MDWFGFKTSADDSQERNSMAATKGAKVVIDGQEFNTSDPAAQKALMSAKTVNDLDVNTPAGKEAKLTTELQLNGTDLKTAQKMAQKKLASDNKPQRGNERTSSGGAASNRGGDNKAAMKTATKAANTNTRAPRETAGAGRGR